MLIVSLDYVRQSKIVVQVNTLKSKMLKSNFTQIEAFFYFPTKAALCMTILQWISQKRMSRTSAKWNMFFPSHTQTSQTKQVYFTVECPRISILDAGQLDAFKINPRSWWWLYVTVMASVWGAQVWKRHRYTWITKGTSLLYVSLKVIKT